MTRYYRIPISSRAWHIVRRLPDGIEVGDGTTTVIVQPHHLTEIAPRESADREAAAVPPAVQAPSASPSDPAPHGVVAPGSGAAPLTAEPPLALARNTDPAPAHEAAAKVNVHGDAWLVLRAHVEAGERGLTGDDLEAATGRKYQAIGPRRPWLEAQGWVAATGDRRGGKGVYVATAEGVAAWDRHSTEVAA